MVLSNVHVTWGLIFAALQVVIILGVTLRVILTRHPPGASFAWILITTVLPYVGFILYLMFGERPIGRLRAWRYRRLMEHQSQENFLKSLDSDPLPATLDRHRSIMKLACRCANTQATFGNKLELLPDTDSAFRSIVEAIDSAVEHIDMAFYIWHEGGHANNVSQAVLRARARGVEVRVLVDDFASRDFLDSETAWSFRKAGIEVASAMPMRLLRIFGLQRADLRLHRKLIVIDHRVAFTGSMNMIDPATYKAAKEVGDWIDAMVRIEGPALKPLQTVFLTDWYLQPDHQKIAKREAMPDAYPEPGEGVVVAVPSGPNNPGDPNLHLLLEGINQARSSIVLTTPYFVPNEVLATALLNALYRGVDVKLIIPEKCDNPMVSFASRRYFDDLLACGAQILLYKGGLLHTKSLCVDGEFSIFGTVNFDNRSMHLNYELMLLIFEPGFIRDMYRMLTAYEDNCTYLTLPAWRARPWKHRLYEGASFLVSPLL